MGARSSLQSGRFPVSILVEPMEQRCLRSVTGWSANSISDLSGDYFDTIQFGDNGDPWGTATTIAGEGDTQETWSFKQWDSNLDDGLDSGWCTVGFAVNADNSGDAISQTSGSDPVSFSVGTSLTIHSVTIRAGVAFAGLEMDWRNVSVKFYQNGTLAETISLADFGASTMTESGNDPAETGRLVTPTATNDNGVAIVGQVRLMGAQGTYPGPADVFSNVLVS